MRSIDRAIRRTANRRSRPLGTSLVGLFAVLLLGGPLALPEAFVHQHTNWRALCTGGENGSDSAAGCRGVSALAGAHDAPRSGRPADDSLRATSGFCLACAQSAGKAQGSLSASGVSSADADCRALASAPGGFTPDPVAAGDPPPRAPPLV